MSTLTRAEQVRARLAAFADAASPAWTPSDGERGAMLGALNKTLGPGKAKEINARRHVLLAYLFDQSHVAISSGALTPAQWWALREWIGFARAVDGTWLYSQNFLTEAPEVAREAEAENLRREGQLLMELGYD